MGSEIDITMTPSFEEQEKIFENKLSYSFIGPHRTKFELNTKNEQGNYLSTGQQASLLLSLTLSSIPNTDQESILLLDDLLTNLDKKTENKRKRKDKKHQEKSKKTKQKRQKTKETATERESERAIFPSVEATDLKVKPKTEMQRECRQTRRRPPQSHTAHSAWLATLHQDCATTIDPSMFFDRTERQHDDYTARTKRRPKGRPTIVLRRTSHPFLFLSEVLGRAPHNPIVGR